MNIQTGDRSVLVRPTRSYSVRIVGLSDKERNELKRRIYKQSKVDGNAVVVQCGHRGWLDIREGGIFFVPPEERKQLISARQESIVKLVKTIVGGK